MHQPLLPVHVLAAIVLGCKVGSWTFRIHEKDLSA